MKEKKNILMKQLIFFLFLSQISFSLSFTEEGEIPTELKGISGLFITGEFQGSNLEYVPNYTNKEDENYAYFVEKEGYQGLHLDGGKYAYFKVLNDAITTDDHDLFIHVTYFDEGTKGIGFHYNSVGDESIASYYKARRINLSNSKKWVTTTICISDAAFRKKQNNNADFRFGGDGQIGATIARIEITKESVDPSGEPVVELTRDTKVSEFKGKTVAGYQGWFSTGGQYEGWQHYSANGAESDGTNWPRPNHICIDLYPYVWEYDESILAPTGFDELGDGKPAKLFNSDTENAINTHFEWMKNYGIDGAAVQRFVGGITGRAMSSNVQADQLYKIKEAAEANGRLFYVMYDISGGIQNDQGNDELSSYVKDMEFDWVYKIEKTLKLTESKAYATVDGKPVVCLWGLGVGGRPDKNGDYKELINFYHKRGCYVIIGTSGGFRNDGEDKLNIYFTADMISPWMVGAFKWNTEIEGAYDGMTKDKAMCAEHGVEFQPVVFSGFSWTLWNNQIPNYFPRNAGEFLWYQVYKAKTVLKTDFVYIAMFDEYDEGTAIAKMASDYFDIPKNQYFVTNSADGYWLSPDFQLRVVTEAIKMIKGEIEPIEHCPVEHSLGPIYYRNSFESKYVVCKETQYNGDYKVDPCFKNEEELTAYSVKAKTEIVKTDLAKTGDYAVKVSGVSQADDASYIFKISETKIKVKKGMKLSYSIRAENDLGKNTYVDLLFEDGDYASSKGIKENDVKMGAGSQKGEVGAWKEYEFTFGIDELVDHRIVGVIIGYSGEEGEFSALFDNIIIQDGK